MEIFEIFYKKIFGNYFWFSAIILEIFLQLLYKFLKFSYIFYDSLMETLCLWVSPIFSFLIMVFCSAQTERLRWRRCVYENNECFKVIGLTSAFSHGWWWLVMVMTNKGIPHDICFWEEPGWQPIRYKEATNQRQYANRLLQAPTPWNGWWWLWLIREFPMIYASEGSQAGSQSDARKQPIRGRLHPLGTLWAQFLALCVHLGLGLRTVNMCKAA